MKRANRPLEIHPSFPSKDLTYLSELMVVPGTRPVAGIFVEDANIRRQRPDWLEGFGEWFSSPYLFPHTCFKKNWNVSSISLYRHLTSFKEPTLPNKKSKTRKLRFFQNSHLAIRLLCFWTAASHLAYSEQLFWLPTIPETFESHLKHTSIHVLQFKTKRRVPRSNLANGLDSPFLVQIRIILQVTPFKGKVAREHFSYQLKGEWPF